MVTPRIDEESTPALRYFFTVTRWPRQRRRRYLLVAAFGECLISA